MTHKKQKILVLLLLFGGPWLAVHAVRGRLDPLRDTPKARQKGDPKAPVIITEYSDFQCPNCASIQPTIHQLLENHAGQVRLAYKYYPLERIHRNAMPAAQAAECAADQNQFWPYHDQLFVRQKSWSNLLDPTSSFVTLAGELKLDQQRFAKCLTDDSKRLAIQLDKAEGDKQMVESTPTFFVGDQRYVGNVFAAEAEKVIQRAARR